MLCPVWPAPLELLKMVTSKTVFVLLVLFSIAMCSVAANQFASVSTEIGKLKTFGGCYSSSDSVTLSATNAVTGMTSIKGSIGFLLALDIGILLYMIWDTKFWSHFRSGARESGIVTSFTTHDIPSTNDFTSPEAWLVN